MSEELDDRREKMQLDLAEMLMKTIPPLPHNINELTQDKRDEIFKAIDSRAERILELLGNKRKVVGTRRGRPPLGERRTERFNTPELDVGIRKKTKKEE